MVKSTLLRRQPGPLRRILNAIGEISALRSSWPASWSFQYSKQYTLDSSRVDYVLARELYRNINDRYKLGAGFAKPVINITASFMGAPHFTHPDPEADQALEQIITRWTGKTLRVQRNTLRDGDVFARITRVPDRFGKKGIFDLTLIPPEWVMPIPDPLTGQWLRLIIRHPVAVYDETGRKTGDYTVTETLTTKERIIEADARAPAEIRERNGTEVNPWGFIPMVHFRNEAEENQMFGCSELEPVEPFMKAYHDTMLFATQGSKLFSRPKAKFSLKSVDKFLQDNFSADEIKAGKLRFADKEIFLLQEGDDASFITADSGLAGITTLLKFLYFCIIDVSETPEFAFGTAVASSKASVSEQMIPLARKIRRKRGMFEEPYGELAAMFLTMWAKVENRTLDTYRTDIGWDELSPKNDKEVADTIKTLVDGLVTAIEGGLLSVDAAAEFLREYIPTALPYADEDAADDERRRIAKSFLWRKRLEDGGAGWDRGQASEMFIGEIDDLQGAQDPFVYLIHHIHHIAGKGKNVKEELHHCPLFVDREAEGEYYEVDDLRIGDKLYHVLKTKGQEVPPEALFDHLGNEYVIRQKELSGKKVWVIIGLKRGQKVKWSDAEA